MSQKVYAIITPPVFLPKGLTAILLGDYKLGGGTGGWGWISNRIQGLK